MFRARYRQINYTIAVQTIYDYFCLKLTKFKTLNINLVKFMEKQNYVDKHQYHVRFTAVTFIIDIVAYLT